MRERERERESMCVCVACDCMEDLVINFDNLPCQILAYKN